MDASIVLAEIFGSLCILVGLSALTSRSLTAAIEEMARSRALTWFAGLFTFTIGVASLAFYSAWPSDWRVIVTIIGWLTVIKGAYITLVPAGSMRFYRQMLSGGMRVVVGVIAIAIGLLLFYLAGVI